MVRGQNLLQLESREVNRSTIRDLAVLAHLVDQKEKNDQLDTVAHPTLTLLYLLTIIKSVSSSIWIETFYSISSSQYSCLNYRSNLKIVMSSQATFATQTSL